MRSSMALVVVSLAFLQQGESRAQGTVKDINSAVRALKSERAAERLAGLTFLAKLGTKASAASRDVVSVLHDTNAEVRKQALATLSEINPDIAPYVVELIKASSGNKGDDLEDRFYGLSQLALLGDKAAPAVPAIVAFYQTSDTVSRLQVIRTLSTVGKADASLAAFFANVAVTATDTNTREAALMALAKQRDQNGGLDVLKKAMASDGDAKQKVRLVGGLAELAKGNEGAQRMLEAAARGDQPPEVQQAAKKALEKLRK